MKIGFIGCGNMAGAMIRGIVSSSFTSAANILAVDHNYNKLEALNLELGITISLSVAEMMEQVEIVVLAMKPSGYYKALAVIKPLLKKQQIVLTIAAGISLSDVEQIIGSDSKVVRTMPNTPAAVGKGITAMVVNNQITPVDGQKVTNLLESFGKVEQIDEALMHTFIATAGSLPAIVDIMVESLADGAVLNGMGRDAAYRILGEAIAGSIAMLKQSNQHPGALKDAVCSPGGTTIAMVAAAEKGNLRSTLIETITAGVEKSQALSKNN
ncbi:MAG: pyrroline-5-carboxylate reductase [Culicoidibacterales bacterium]